MSLSQMTHADYLCNPAYGASDIIKMGDSFAAFDEKRKHPDPAGRPLVIGSATHLMLQSHMMGSPDLITNGIFIYRDGSSLTKGFKEFQAKNPKFYCIDQEEEKLCQRMIKALLDEEEVMGYLKDAIPELTVINNYPNTNIPVKRRPDYLHKKRGVTINVKTAADASESGFLYATKDFQYDWQSVLDIDMFKQEFGQPFDDIYIVVQKGNSDAECPVNIFMFDEDTIGFARQQIWEVLQKIPACEKSGKWPKNKAYLKQLGLPPFMRKLVQI